VTRVMMYVTAA